MPQLSLLAHSPTPSPDQAQALISVLSSNDRIRIVTGPAGSGKSQLMKWLAAELYARNRGVRGVAPTGCAAKVATARTGIEFTTIHRARFTKSFRHCGELIFSQPKQICEAGEDVFVDEAYMVGQRLVKELLNGLPPDSCLYVFGDRNQLKPVKAECGFDFENPTAVLSQIHRQTDGSPIIALASTFLGVKFTGWVPGVTELFDRLPDTSQVVQWYLTQQTKTGETSVLLTTANRTRHWLNQQIRAALGYTSDEPQVGDIIVCLSNNSNALIANGETGRVLRVWDEARDLVGAEVDFSETPVYMRVSWRGNSQKYHDGAKNNKKYPTLIDWDWGRALTVHKAQGSQYDHVGLLCDGYHASHYRGKPEEENRAKYTAVTRAIKSCFIFKSAISFGRDMVLPGVER